MSLISAVVAYWYVINPFWFPNNCHFTHHYRIENHINSTDIVWKRVFSVICHCKSWWRGGIHRTPSISDGRFTPYPLHYAPIESKAGAALLDCRLMINHNVCHFLNDFDNNRIINFICNKKLLGLEQELPGHCLRKAISGRQNIQRCGATAPSLPGWLARRSKAITDTDHWETTIRW